MLNPFPRSSARFTCGWKPESLPRKSSGWRRNFCSSAWTRYPGAAKQLDRSTRGKNQMPKAAKGATVEAYVTTTSGTGAPGFLGSRDLQLLIFAGKGGVGKTTCATATAL